MIETRTLAPGDEAIAERFLAGHAASSMFLRSNLRARGLVYHGQPLEAVWAAAFTGGEIVAIAAHGWNGNLLVQAPDALPEVVRAVVRASGRPVCGLLGPWEQVVATRAALGLADAATNLDECENLYFLDLARLSVPQALTSGQVSCARATAADRELLVPWRMAYGREALGQPDSPSLEAETAAEIDLQLGARSLWILSAARRAVASTGFNSQLPDCVQVGGVWTPPELRGRGYARAAVAGSLLDARAAGATSSVLFTGADNVAACRAYEALGYRAIGKYGLVLLAEPTPALV